MKKERMSRALVALLGGATVGTGLALLLASQTGPASLGRAQTRERLPNRRGPAEQGLPSTPSCLDTESMTPAVSVTDDPAKRSCKQSRTDGYARRKMRRVRLFSRLAGRRCLRGLRCGLSKWLTRDRLLVRVISTILRGWHRVVRPPAMRRPLPIEVPSLVLAMEGYENLRCPVPNCAGLMIPHPRSRHRKGLQLLSVRCEVCGHQGFCPTEDLAILFGGQHEQVCGYGSSTSTLTVVFSAAALQQFQSLHLSLSQSTRYVTQWALLCGQTEGTVQLSQETPTLSRSYEYVRRLLHRRVSTAA